MSDHLTLVPEPMSNTKANAKLTDADILQYLREHPQFMRRNPDVIDLLLPDAKGEKGIADFQKYMIERLKADKSEVIEATRELVENARSNMGNQQRIHDAVLRLLEAERFDDFIQTMTMDLAPMLGVDIAVFLVEAQGESIPQISTNGIRMIPEDTIAKWMDDKIVMLQDNISGIEAIYGGGATLVQSQILLRIGISADTPPALLAFGSRDPNMFNEGQSTDQILFFARVIERTFRSWLKMPV